MSIGRSSIPAMVAALACGVAGAACGPATETVRMDPLRFAASRTEGGVRVDLLDPEVLFLEGVRAYDQKRPEEAARKFGLILDHFGNSRFAKPALFNRGLALLAVPRPAEAAADFERYIAEYPADADVPDAWHRLGQALCEAAEWSRAEAALRKRAGMEPRSLLLEVELGARLALVLRMLGRYEEAREEAARVLSLHDRNATLPEMDGNYYVAMASFQAAEVFHDLFARIKFVLPVERMEKDLLDKATLFMKAQAEYLRTMRLRNSFWGVSAGVRIGRLYEEFYDDILSAEVPPDLSPEELRVYRDELKRRTRGMVAKAVDAYERNLALARMHGAREDWFGDMPARLERLRRLLAEMPPPEP